MEVEARQKWEVVSRSGKCCEDVVDGPNEPPYLTL